MFHLKALKFLVFLLVGIQGPEASVKKTITTLKVPTSKDVKAAKYLEDSYWAFRRGKARWMKNSYTRLKNLKNKNFTNYLSVLSEGIDLRKNLAKGKVTSCPHKKGQDAIENKFYKLFFRTCLKSVSKNILKGKKSLSKSEKEFIKTHWRYLANYRRRNQFKKLIDGLEGTDKVFISKVLRDYIFNSKRLPHKDLLEYVVIDKKLTKFIQELKLFDHSDRGFFSREFSKLVSHFKQEYLRGNDDEAKEVLESAIDFYEQNSDKIDNSKAWALFITSGKKVARRDDYSLALDLFKLSEKTADNDKLLESKFQSLFTLYREKKLHDARRFIKSENLVENFDTINSKLRFWVAQIYQESKEYKMAKELYLKQISLNPLSFYSILSLKNLRRFNPNYTVDLLINKKEEPLNHNLSRETLTKTFLFDTFKKADSTFLSNILAWELRRIPSKRFFNKTNIENAEANKSYFLIKFFSEREDHLSSFKVAYTNLNKGKIDLNNLVISSLFPDRYREKVSQQIKNIDDTVVLSLIRQESAFNRKARSVVGARGLMQIMPATGRQFVRNLKAYKLYDPDLNIRIGTKYLERLLKRYDGNLIYTLAAYNAGMGNVGKWLKSIPFTEDMVSNIEMIPFKETRNYVKLIYRNLFFYRYKEGNISHIDLPTNQTFMVSLN